MGENWKQINLEDSGRPWAMKEWSWLWKSLSSCWWNVKESYSLLTEIAFEVEHKKQVRVEDVNGVTLNR